MMRRFRLAVAFLTVVATLFLSACGGTAAPVAPTEEEAPVATAAPEAETVTEEEAPTPTAAEAEAMTEEEAPAEQQDVTIAVGTFVLNAPYAWLMMPQALGYWEEMGYNVRVEPVGASLDAIQQLVGGNADFVQADSAVIIQANVQEDIPLRTVMETGVIDYGLVVPEDSDITEVEDFVGKQIGVFSLSSGSIPLLNAYLAEHGVDPESDVALVPVGFGPQASEALNRGDVDALLLWGGALAQLENLGHEFRYFRSDQWVQMPGFVLATDQEMLEENRQTAVDIVKGTVMATVFATANPECVVRLQWANWPDTKPADVDEETALAWDIHALESQLRTMEAAFTLHGSDGWGIATPEEFERLQEFLLATEQIDSSLDPATYVVNDPAFWEEVNDFDHEAVRQQAEACDFEGLEQ